MHNCPGVGADSSVVGDLNLLSKVQCPWGHSPRDECYPGLLERQGGRDLDSVSGHQDILVWSLSFSNDLQENKIKSTSFAIDSFFLFFIF